jgi:hypothetical protein
MVRPSQTSEGLGTVCSGILREDKERGSVAVAFATE